MFRPTFGDYISVLTMSASMPHPEIPNMELLARLLQACPSARKGIRCALSHLGLFTRRSKHSQLGYSALMTESPSTAQHLRFAYLIQNNLCSNC